MTKKDCFGLSSEVNRESSEPHIVLLVRLNKRFDASSFIFPHHHLPCGLVSLAVAGCIEYR